MTRWKFWKRKLWNKDGANVGRSDVDPLPRPIQTFTPLKSLATKRPPDLLTPRPPLYILKWIALIFVGTFILGIVYVLYQTDFDWVSLKTSLTSEVAFTIFASLILSICASILGAVSYGYMEDRDNAQKLTYISSLAEADYLEDIIADLQFYKGRYYLDYSIRIKLEKIDGKPGFVLLTREDSYRKKFDSNSVSARIVRSPIDTHSTHEVSDNELSEIFSVYEIFQRFDEQSIEKSVRDDSSFDELYQIKNILINRKHNLHLEAIEGNRRHLRAKLPDRSRDQNGLVQFNIDYQWPMELGSFYSIILEFPCRGLEITVDYKEVADSIDLIVEDFLSSRVGAPLPIDDEEKGIKKLYHHGWQPSKSNVCLIWWPK